MPCYRPLLAHRSQTTSENGKRPLTFKIGEAYSDLPVMVPCGKCIGCRIDKRSQWASRCVHESKLHTHNSFVTLTYDDEHIPPGGTLVKEHLQLFMKRLREKIEPIKIRFYGCGEYGSKLSRPHYHLLIFGYDFPDKQLHAVNRKQGQQLYTSKELQSLWQNGFSSIGLFDLASAKYVASYSMKKITNENSDKHYQGKEPEFALMSRRPGIGHDWLQKYTSDVYPKDYFTIKGVRHRPSRYYDTLLEKKSPKKMEKIRNKRCDKAKQTDKGGIERYRRAEAKEAIIESLERRRFENE